MVGIKVSCVKDLSVRRYDARLIRRFVFTRFYVRIECGHLRIAVASKVCTEIFFPPFSYVFSDSKRALFSLHDLFKGKDNAHCCAVGSGRKIGAGDKEIISRRQDRCDIVARLFYYRDSDIRKIFTIAELGEDTYVVDNTCSHFINPFLQRSRGSLCLKVQTSPL